MKKLLFLMFLFVFTFTPVYSKNLKFIQVTDVHLNIYNEQYLADFVNEINENYNDLDFIVFTGDNIDKANYELLNDFLEIIKNLKIKTYVLVGNHDVFKNQNLDKKLYMKTVRKKLGIYHSDKTNYVFEKDNIIFIVMDGVKEVIPGTNGYYKQKELDWLDKTLTKYNNKKVVIFQHFPLLDSYSRRHNLYNKESYIEILNKHKNVISVISGHYHQNIEQMQDNIYHIVTMRFLNNRYYKVIEIDKATGMVFTNLIDKEESENSI